MANNQSKTSRYLTIRKKTEELVKPLQIEDFVAQPVEDVSPPKWHLGHTTWFFENFILKNYKKDYTLFSNDFAFVFNSYYESQGERILRNKRGTLTRPSTEEIFNYRSYVDEQMQEFINSPEFNQPEINTFFEVGLNHEQQHQELLITDIKYILGSNPLTPKYTEVDVKSSLPQKVEWLTIKAGNYNIGYSGPEFHFDNEEGVHTVYAHQFEIMNRLVSNAEYLEFMNDDGYSRAELWLMEGWQWVKDSQSKAPFYWFQENGEWYNYQLNGIQEIDANLPVTHINFYEAEAFARWKNMRLPTEFEWEIAAGIYANSQNSQFQESDLFQPTYNNSNQFFGTAWEWTNSAYLPYPFYNQEKGALGEYNGKFMVNQMVLRGGSCATPLSHFRKSYRNFFHPHLQWQFTGIRLAK